MTDHERDAWLRAALAHAPDAEVGAPPALSAAILRAATERPGAARRLWRRLIEAASWLTRPPVAAAFASVMVAGLVTVMWWERPIDEVMPRSPVPQVASAAAPSSQGEATPGEATAARDASHAPRAVEVAPSVAAASPQGVSAAKPAPAAAAERRARAPQPPAAAPPAAAEPPAAAPMVAAQEAVRHRAEASADAAEGAPAPAPSPDDTSAQSASVERAAAPALAKAASPARARRIDDAQSMALSASTPPSPLAGLLARWPNPGDGRWQPPDATTSLPLDAAARTWLERAEAATRGRWQARTEAATGPAVLWWQGDALLGTLHFEPDGLAWQGADGRRAFAPLDPATLATLRRH